MINLKNAPIDQNDLTYDSLFSNLQGNILKQHGRSYTTNIFLKFDKNKHNSAKKWINNFSNQITSCKKQLSENANYKRNGVSGGTFFSLLLSAKAYDYFALDTSGFHDKAFLGGMDSRQSILKDTVKSKWEIGFRETIHAMIIIADTDNNVLGQKVKTIIEQVRKFSKILTIEYGSAIRNENGDGLEHFGYVDGISQPLFFKDEIQKYESQNSKPLLFNPEAQLDLVLVKDPLSNDTDAYGSYFVFRKLEQHVKDFKKAEESLTKSLINEIIEKIKTKPENIGLSYNKLKEKATLIFGDEERGGAMLVGRFEDGTPVTVSETDGWIDAGVYNNFNYDKDSAGAKCPFHSHIRKTNPRELDSKKSIMARRGITYGNRNVSTKIDLDVEQMPNKDVGLLFMSFQRSIVDQFEFIQDSWANKPDFPNPKVGIDPIIGQHGIKNPSKGNFATIYGDKTSMIPRDFQSFVTLKGGEYFFAPSLNFLRNF